MEDILQELRNYQLSYLIPASVTEEDSARTREELVKTLQEQGASVTQSPEAAKKKLAYPIAKQAFAYAGRMVFLAQPNTIPSLNASLRQEEGLLRFVIVKKEGGENFSARADEHFAHSEDARIENKERSQSLNMYAREEVAPTEKIHKEEMPRKEQEKITIEDIDRKLDEIMKNIS